jgi:hypothetical protein
MEKQKLEAIEVELGKTIKFKRVLEAEQTRAAALSRFSSIERAIESGQDAINRHRALIADADAKLPGVLARRLLFEIPESAVQKLRDQKRESLQVIDEIAVALPALQGLRGPECVKLKAADKEIELFGRYAACKPIMLRETYGGSADFLRAYRNMEGLSRELGEDAQADFRGFVNGLKGIRPKSFWGA